MQVAVFGINHKQADVSLRESLASAFQRNFYLKSSIQASVLVATCNRVELYFSGSNLADLHQQILAILREDLPCNESTKDFEQKCYSFFGIDCFLHLAKVTAGLDSAIVAETEIQGQVRTSYEQAKNTRTLTPALHKLFQRSLHIGKTTRSRYFQGKSVPDLEHAILFQAHEFFGQTLPPLLFIGASEINIKIARFFSKKGIKNISFCNRTLAKSEEIAEELGMSALAWEQLQSEWSKFQWVIAGAKSFQYLLRPQSHPFLDTAPKLLIDLAVPRNIHPMTVTKDTGTLLNIDHLQALLDERRLKLNEALLNAEAFIDGIVVETSRPKLLSTGFAVA